MVSEQTMTLLDKLYKSSEVCDILGVSLRTLYRYIEDGKMGSVQLSSGRHRFTKDQIEKFLQLGPDIREKETAPAISYEEKSEVAINPNNANFANNTEISKDAEKVKETEEIKEEEVKEVAEITKEAEKPEETFSMMGLGDSEPQFKPLYFRCPFDDLKVIAKLIKRAGENASADYAFTGPAGLSLFYPIKAFDKLHFYVSPDQMDFWKLRLQLEDASDESANVVIIKPETVEVFDLAGERGGLKHASIEQLKEDLRNLGMMEELKEFESKGY